MIIIGVDPDSKAHGVAIYENGTLINLENLTLMEFNNMLDFWYQEAGRTNIEVHIEDVCGNNAVFMKHVNSKKSIAEAKARGRTLGMCQQSQIELERLIEYWDIKIVKHKISKMWKKDKKQFEMVTGWVGRSNEDNRSAAYFAFLGVKK